MAVVAAEDPQTDADLIAVLDRGVLAPGRTYLKLLPEIKNGRVFSRVGGVALGDAYGATLSHDLSQTPLHVPLTSTNRTTFGTREVQVNALASRMLDSSLDNVGTYGVRFDVTLNLKGNGPYELVLSHPTAYGKQFTSFRGSIGIQTHEGYKEVHVGMQSGESLSLNSLTLLPGVNNPVTVSLVYPADATPGHLLSVVPAQQLAQLRERERLVEIARAAAAAAAAKPKLPPAAPPSLASTGEADGADPRPKPPASPPPAASNPAKPRQAPAPSKPSARPVSRPAVMPAWIQPLPPIPLPLLNRTNPVPSGSQGTQALLDRYQQAAQAQQHVLNEMMGR
jgi:hypothetical protein